MKVYELLKKPLETGLIEMADSAWASPIVIALKKNGVDIRMCIDYRLVNRFIEVSNYPLPLIDDLLRILGHTHDRESQADIRVRVSVGYFQWIRMPFGLKNAPLIYQEMINNCLWGFVRLLPEEEKMVDADVLEFLGLDPAEDEGQREKSAREVPILTDKMTAFKLNILTPSQMGPVLGRSSYIDDIAHGAPTWDQLCEDLNALLYRLRYWNISFSLPKSEFGKLTILTVPNNAQRESLNYYHKFIEDFSVVAAALHELTDEQIKAGRDLSRVKESFVILKRKIVSTPRLRHPDRNKPFVIIPHANRWAAFVVLGQTYDGKILPVRFTGRVPNEIEIKYHEAEKEVIAIMRVLDIFESGMGGVVLSHWDLEVDKVQSDENGLAAIMGTGITPREHLNKVAESLIPHKGRVKPQPVISVEMLEADFDGYVLSFDGTAKTSTRQGSCECSIWKLPGWKVVTAQVSYLKMSLSTTQSTMVRSKVLTMVAERDIPDVWLSETLVS
ncbi:reverse transcriptase [Phytophthora megakarya]|uniref:Reverse transcriptase n=1 Tax=Phytophthora megakarya TaxID=4795 RepID=A0A225VFN0_9STRA|nr:reverse transcriptase [Phytophthora megakarya]